MYARKAVSIPSDGPVSRHPACDDDGGDDLATGGGSRGDTVSVSCGDSVPVRHPSSHISSSIDLHHSAPYWDQRINYLQSVSKIKVVRPKNR